MSAFKPSRKRSVLLRDVSYMKDGMEPPVSIGIPVRNGGSMIYGALDRIAKQTYGNLEIIISDNSSSDETAKICLDFALKDSRIKYYRQNTLINALDNFHFVLDQSSSQYFMWAAHDDRWSFNYVEVLLRKMIACPQASIAFSDVAIFHDHQRWEAAEVQPYDFELDHSIGYWRKIIHREYIRNGYLHIYGLIRKQALSGYYWPATEIGADRPMIYYLSCRGSFVRAEGTIFFCYKPLKPKTQKQKSIVYSLKSLGLFPYVRLSWSCAKAGVLAEKQEGRYRNVYAAFIVFVLKELKKKMLGYARSVKSVLGPAK